MQADDYTSQRREELLSSLHEIMKQQERDAIVAPPASVRAGGQYMPVVALCDGRASVCWVVLMRGPRMCFEGCP